MKPIFRSAAKQTIANIVNQPFLYRHLDYHLILAVLFLITLGLIMVTSATIAMADRSFDQPFYYFWRQFKFVLLGLGLTTLVAYTPMEFWLKYSIRLFMFSTFLLFLLLIPGLGVEVKGSTRWLNMGIIRFQPSEFMKIILIIYLSDYLVRRQKELLSQWSGLLKPLGVIVAISLLLLLQPDFGTVIVIFAIAMGMIYMAGVPLLPILSIVIACIIPGVLLIYYSPYRLARILTYLNPWADPYGSGYQLTQALIAFGRGEMTGVGLGNGIQKLFYLPDAHTDFLFAVLAEELGVFGVLTVVASFSFVLWKIASIAWQSASKDRLFEAYIAYGIGIWIALQSFINMGVNMGILPTKGITLPFMSAGGSSMVSICIAFGLLIRIDYEVRTNPV